MRSWVATPIWLCFPRPAQRLDSQDRKDPERDSEDPKWDYQDPEWAPRIPSGVPWISKGGPGVLEENHALLGCHADMALFSQACAKV